MNCTSCGKPQEGQPRFIVLLVPRGIYYVPHYACDVECLQGVCKLIEELPA